MQLQALKANACDFRLDFAAYTRCSKALSIVGKKKVILNLIMAFYREQISSSIHHQLLSHTVILWKDWRKLPLAALESISFAATPGGLCQLLSNPPTWTWRHKISRISRTQNPQFSNAEGASPRGPQNRILNNVPESQQRHQLCQMIPI